MSTKALETKKRSPRRRQRRARCDPLHVCKAERPWALAQLAQRKGPRRLQVTTLLTVPTQNGLGFLWAPRPVWKDVGGQVHSTGARMLRRASPSSPGVLQEGGEVHANSSGWSWGRGRAHSDTGDRRTKGTMSNAVARTSPSSSKGSRDICYPSISQLQVPQVPDHPACCRHFIRYCGSGNEVK